MKRACAILFLLVLVVVASSCNKTPEPTPKPEPTPTDTIPPVTPNDTIVPTPGIDTIPPAPGGDTIVTPTPGGDTIPPAIGGNKEYLVDFTPSAGGPVYPSLDSIQRWAGIYDTIYLKVRATSGAWTPSGFHVVRDSLSPYFDVSPKVYGKGWWKTYQILDDSQLGNNSLMGMTHSDSTQFANWGYGIYPQISKNNPKATQPQVYKGTMVLPRNNCRGGRVRGR